MPDDRRRRSAVSVTQLLPIVLVVVPMPDRNAPLSPPPPDTAARVERGIICDDGIVPADAAADVIPLRTDVDLTVVVILCLCF